MTEMRKNPTLSYSASWTLPVHGHVKKYLARSFFFCFISFSAPAIENVEIVFIAHHTEASEVTEEEFFHKGESGGTFISSGYPKALEIIERTLPSVSVERLCVSLFRRRQL